MEHKLAHLVKYQDKTSLITNISDDTTQQSNNMKSKISKSNKLSVAKDNDFYNLTNNRIKDFEHFAKKILNSMQYNKSLYEAYVNCIEAHIKMCIKKSIIPSNIGEKLITELQKVKIGILKGEFEIKGDIDSRNYDVFDQIKTVILTNIGEDAHYLNIGCSKYEIGSAALRIWTKRSLLILNNDIANLQLTLARKAEANVKIPIPIYLYGQQMQSTSLAQYLMAYVEMFNRDKLRINESITRTNSSPLGSYFGVGTSLEVNRKMTARALNFDSVITNTIDAFMDRDFVVEFLSLLSICAIHINRLAQDLLTWQHHTSNFISFSDQFLSIDHLVNKPRYPETLECIKTKSLNVHSHLASILSSLGNITNNTAKDVMELADAMISSYDTITSCIDMMNVLISDFSVNRKRMKEQAQNPYSFGPDILAWLLRNTDLNYIEAVTVTSKLIKYAIDNDKKLSLLELDELQAIEPKIDSKIYSVLITSRAIVSRRSYGGSNPVQVRKTIRGTKKKLAV